MSNSFQVPVTRKEVLERAKKIKKYGICYSITQALVGYDILFDCRFLNIWFPKFVRDNALQFGANTYSKWWWEPDVWDTGRMDFLDWLIEQYKDDKTDLRKIL